VAVDVLTGLLPGEVSTYVVERVGGLRRGRLTGPRLVRGELGGPHDVVEDRSHRRSAVYVEVRLHHLAEAVDHVG